MTIDDNDNEMKNDDNENEIKNIDDNDDEKEVNIKSSFLADVFFAFNIDTDSSCVNELANILIKHGANNLAKQLKKEVVGTNQINKYTNIVETNRLQFLENQSKNPNKDIYISIDNKFNAAGQCVQISMTILYQLIYESS